LTLKRSAEHVKTRLVEAVNLKLKWLPKDCLPKIDNALETLAKPCLELVHLEIYPDNRAEYSDHGWEKVSKIENALV
jgi:hypothetical protein